MLMGIIILGAVFALSNTIRDSNSKQMSSLLADTLLSKIEGKILDLTSIARASGSSSQLLMNVPSEFGNQEYRIIGRGHEIIVRTMGTQSIARSRKISEVGVKGVGTPPQIKLYYNISTNNVTIR